MSGTLQPFKRFGAMGVERQHLADQGGGTPSLDNSVKRGGLMTFGSTLNIILELAHNLIIYMVCSLTQ